MDGAGRRLHDVIFLAATNHPGALDGAMLRGGRFSEKIAFRLPSDEIIRDFVRRWMAGVSLRFDRSFTPDSATPTLHGLSLATVHAVLKGTINQAFLAKDPQARITLTHLRQALGEVS